MVAENERRRKGTRKQGLSLASWEKEGCAADWSALLLEWCKID